MTQEASPKKTNWANIWSAVAAVAAIGALIFAGLSYFRPSPYQLEAKGDYVSMRLPESLLVNGVNDLKAVFPDPSPTDVDKIKITNNVIQQIKDILAYRHNFTFTLQNKGNKEVSNIKLMFPGGGLYQVVRKDPKVNTEKFNNEIPIGALSPTDEITVLVWTDNERARDLEDRMRFVHPEGVVQAKFSNNLDVPFWMQAIVFVVLISVIINFIGTIKLFIKEKSIRNR
jgi:hypothetical protein